MDRMVHSKYSTRYVHTVRTVLVERRVPGTYGGTVPVMRSTHS